MLLCVSGMMAQFNGAGTLSNPYLISSDEDLLNFATAVNEGNDFSGKFFRQTADIDLTESQIFAEGFTPIGDYDMDFPFSGTYDGDGHSIIKLVVENANIAAMFAYLHNGCIKNLNLENENVHAYYGTLASGLVGEAENSTISNVTVSGQVSATGVLPSVELSGIVGSSTGTEISGCVSMLSFDVTLATGENVYIAGVAMGSDVRVTNCLVSTFIRTSGLDNLDYFLISSEGVAINSIIAESNVVPSECEVTYTNCYFDHQNTVIAEYPYSTSDLSYGDTGLNGGIQVEPTLGKSSSATSAEGLYAKTTALLTSGSIFNDPEHWTETAGLYPRPAAVANTNVALLAASPMTLDPSDYINSVARNFTVSTANNVQWFSESSLVQVDGENVILEHGASDSIAEMYAFRNNTTKTKQINVLNNAEGSRANPIRISTEEDLRQLAEMLYSGFDGFLGGYNSPGVWKSGADDYLSDADLYFLVDADITVSSDSAWIPIGYGYNTPFRWHFDGGNHTINLGEVSDSSLICFGLFGNLSGAVVSNLTVTANITSDYANFVGGIAAMADSTLFSNCTFIGSIDCPGSHVTSLGLSDHKSSTSDRYVGGIAGSVAGVAIHNCVNMAALGDTINSSTTIDLGGIVGAGSNSLLSTCVNAGDIYGETSSSNGFGGLIGHAEYMTIDGCAVYSEVVSGCGIAGIISSSTVSNCANYGNDAIAFAFSSTSTLYEGNVTVPGNAYYMPYTAKTSVLMELTYDDKTDYNVCENNYTDKQYVPTVGFFSGFESVLTSELTSSAFDKLDASKWIFNNGRYPMPVGTDIDCDVVKLATTPILLSAANGDNYNSVKSVRSSFGINSNDGITWTLDGVTLTENTVNLDSLRQDSTSVFVSIYSSRGHAQRHTGLVLPARFGSPENPLLIESLADFNEFSAAISASKTDSTASYKGVRVPNGGAELNFRLTADIAAEDNVTNIVNLQPVSDFSGKFHGGGHTITVTAADVKLPNVSKSGLFNSISYAIIDSLNVAVDGDISLTDVSTASLFCGEVSNSTVCNCSVTLDGTMTVNSGALLFGSIEGSYISNCSTLGNGNLVVGDGGYYLAGVAYIVRASKLIGVTNNVNISEGTGYARYAAGVVAVSYGLILENCVNNSNVSAKEYSAGILVEAEDNMTIILKSVNNGIITGVGNGTSGTGIACGIAGYGEYSTSGTAIVKIEKCVNAGKIIGGQVCGIMAESYATESSIVNCANYGSMQSEYDINGIAYNVPCVGNIVACRVQYESVGDDEDVSQNIISEAYCNENFYDEQISDNRFEEDFFEEEMPEIRVDSLSHGFYDSGTPRTTQTMVGSALANDLPGDWDFTEGLYPLPLGIDPNDPRNKLARLPIMLVADGIGRNERITAIISDFTLPQVDGVIWSSSDESIIMVPSGGGVATVTNPETDTDVTITATCEGYSRDFVVKVYKAMGTTPYNPVLVSSCEDFVSLSSSNRYPCGGYHLYFKQTSPIEMRVANANNSTFTIRNGAGGIINPNPLFAWRYKFHGHYDGNGQSIKWENTGYTDGFYGLFKYTEDAEISNLSLYVNEMAQGSIGGLVGYAKSTHIKNCAVYGELESSQMVGGIAHICDEGSVIENCLYVGYLESMKVGGLVGTAINSRIANSLSMVECNEMQSNIIDASLFAEGKNVVVDSCLVIGSNASGNGMMVCGDAVMVSVNNCYYDNQMWIPAASDNRYNIIGMPTREIFGLFANSPKWTNAEGKYPVPAGTEMFAPAMLAANPMLINANDINVNHVTSINLDDSDQSFVWSYNSSAETSPINEDFSIGCVDNETGVNITATLSDEDLGDMSFTRTIVVTKGLFEVEGPAAYNVCEGGDITYRILAGDATYDWSVVPEMDVTAFNGDSITLHVPSNMLLENNVVELTLNVNFGTCEKSEVITFAPKPSTSHLHINDTSICIGSDIIVSCKLDDGYEEYTDSFFLNWYDASDMNTSLLDDTVSAMGYYIPILNEDRNLRIIAGSIEGDCVDTLDVALTVIPSSSVTLVSGEPNQQICEGEPIEPIIFSVANPTYALPYGVYAEYDTTNNLLTLTGHPSNTYNSDNTYTISSCGSEFNGIMDVSYFRSSAMSNQSLVVNLGEEVDMSFYGEFNLENLITWGSLDGSETFTAEELGLEVSSHQDEDGISSYIEGTAEMPGEFIFHITIPAYENCPSITYDNFLGVYDNSDLIATALDTTICIGETATLTTVERPGAYGGDYVWTVGNDTIGSGDRIYVVPQQTTTYNVLCGGKRMVGDFEIGDYVYWDEDLSESGYSMEKYFEYNTYHNETGYLIVNIEEDSLLLMTLARLEEAVWSPEATDVTNITNYATVQEAMNDMNGRANSSVLAGIGGSAAAMLIDDGMGYLPSAGEFGNVIDNYQRFMTFFRENSIHTAILTSTEKNANTVYAFNPEYGLILEHPKTEPALALGFKKIGKNEIVNMVGRTSDIRRYGSVNVIVSEHQEISAVSDDDLCHSDTAMVGIVTDYPYAEWYNLDNPETEIVVDNGSAYLPAGHYVAVGTDVYASCHDTASVIVKNMMFDIPLDTVCDSLVYRIAKENVMVMIGDEVAEDQTIVITETGNYTITLIATDNDCREERSFDFVVNHSVHTSFDTIVYDDTFTWNGEVYSASGDYDQQFVTVNGCDSIVTAHVIIVNTETEFALFGVVTRSDGVSPLEGVDVLAEGTSVTTGNDGSYTIMIPKTNPMVKFSKQGYNVICDSISEGGAYNVSMFKPEVEVSMEEDTTPVTPYAMRQVVVQLSNTGDGPLTWSSVVEADVNNGGRRMHPRSSAPMWDHADDVIVTNSNAEQAIATDGYYIYTASWHHAGVFNRYSPDNGYVETFVIDGVGPVRNLSYGNGTFFATDNTNKIYMINMDTQTLENVIELNDPDLQIRYCAYSTEEDLLYIGNWTELYKLVAYNTAYPTMVPLSYSMDNVYSIAYDDFSGTTPCLWAFSQISENNGPFAKIYKLNKNGVQVGGMVHYINDAALASPTSLAGGICVSQNLYGDKFVLLANIQNSNANNNIAVYELGSKPSWAHTDQKSGVIPAGGSIDLVVSELATENGDYSAVVKIKPAVFMPQNTEINLSMSVASPTCSPAVNLIAETDTFHVVNLSWDEVVAGENESVSYLVYDGSSAMPIDTAQTNSYTVSDPEPGQHCYYVRAFMRGETDCVSEPSNTECIEIMTFPCDGQLNLTARTYGDRIRLEWNELYGVEHYVVIREDGALSTLVSGYATEYEDSTIDFETDYCYYILALFRNGECDSKTSNTSCARISTGGCTALPVATAKAIGNSVAVAWTPVQGMQSYSLYKDGKYLTSTSDTIYYDMSLEYETEYCYVVEINCGYGNYGLSDAVCVTTEAEVGEENAVDLVDSESIDLYPNPASDRFMVSGQAMKSVSIVNFAGQLVYELDNIMDDSIVIETEGFITGVYAVRITLVDGNTVIKRIVISK